MPCHPGWFLPYTGNIFDSVNVLPVFLLEQISKDKKYDEKYQDVNPNPVTDQFRRFAEIDQKMGKIKHGFVVFFRRTASGFFQLQSVENFGFNFFFDSISINYDMTFSLYRLVNRALIALPFIEDMRHGHIRKNDIIPTGRRFVVSVKASEISINPFRTA